ncbi:MAG: YafY family protein [Pseudomonadales bacterium]
MDRTERFYKIESLLHRHRVVTVDDFLQELGVSHATFKRDLEYLRDRICAPIVFDRALGGYRFDSQEAAALHELPGLWFNASEVHALLSMQQLLDNIEPGLLTPQIQPLRTRLQSLLARDDFSAQEVSQRIKLVHAIRRPIHSRFFEQLATATLRRKRLRIQHWHRERDTNSTREVSPQQLIYYRNNWYLDAWCHQRNALRSFAVDAITEVEFIDKAAKNIASATLKAQLENGYGIFSNNKKVAWASLRFTPERSRWVAQEVWHSKQRLHTHEDHSITLEVPYSDDRELLMDILKHGAEVQVIKPAALKKRVRDEAKKMLR